MESCFLFSVFLILLFHASSYSSSAIFSRKLDNSLLKTRPERDGHSLSQARAWKAQRRTGERTWSCGPPTRPLLRRAQNFSNVPPVSRDPTAYECIHLLQLAALSCKIHRPTWKTLVRLGNAPLEHKRLRSQSVNLLRDVNIVIRSMDH